MRSLSLSRSPVALASLAPLTAAFLVLGPGLRPATAQLLGPEFQVNSYTTSAQRYPAVAGTGSGSFVVVWQGLGQDGSSNGVFGQRFNPAGSKVGSELQVNTYTTDDQRSSAVAGDGSGGFIVVWDSPQDGSFDGVFGQRFSSAGSPVGSEFQVNSYTLGFQLGPAVAADGAGNFVVVWQSFDQDGDNSGVFGQRFDSVGSPVGSAFQVNSFTTSAQYTPVVATDGSGNFVVVWTGALQEGPSSGIFGQRFDAAGARLGSEFQVNTYTTNAQREPALGVDSAGNFVVVWQSDGQDGAGHGVFGQRFDSVGSPAGSEFQVNTYTTYRQWFPAVAADGAGTFVVVWESGVQDGSIYGVFGQRFNSAGEKVGSELQVNNYTLGFQEHPAVAADGAGNFVVAWESLGQDGSTYGVFGRQLRFSVFRHDFEDIPPFWSDTTAAMCSGHCVAGGTPDGVCFCDAACLTIGDCCLDACNTCGQCVP